jgi:hypothetical protein
MRVMEIKNCLNSLRYRKIPMHWGWLIVFILIYFFRAFKLFDNPIAPDAALVYLPYAKNVLEQGMSFLLKPESIMVSPVSYLWPALFGGGLTVVKYANLVAGMFMVMFAYGIGRRLHSRPAGLIAAFLFAMSPFLVSWIPTALSEPPFFLFTLIWFWCLGEIISGKKWAIPVAAIALSLSILTRSVWLYPSILFLILIYVWIFYNPKNRENATNLAVALSLGLVLPVLVIIKNIIFFDLPSIDTGAGNALFYGANIMTNGFEPPLLGLAYENGVTPDIFLYNKEHATVAMQFFKERSWFELLDWYITKITWVTFFTTLEASIKDSVWRAVEVAMTVTGIWWGIRQKNILLLLMGVGVILQIFQTAFVLYNIRYSTDNLELLLIPMAAVGIALSFNIEKEKIINGESVGYKEKFLIRNKYGIAGAAIAITLFVLLYFRAVPTINLPSHIPVSILFESKDPLRAGHASFSGKSKRANEYNVELSVPKQVLPPGVGNALWEIRMAILPVAGSICEKSSVSLNALQNPPSKIRTVNFNVHDDGLFHTYLIGTANSNAGLFPIEPSSLHLKFYCQSNVRVVVENISLVAPHFIETYFKND